MTPEPVIRMQAHALDTRREIAPLIEGFAGPVEVIAGERDRVCPPVLHEELTRCLPNARLSIIPECGHMITLEQPAPVIDALRRLTGT